MKPLLLYAALGALLCLSALALTYARFEAPTREPEAGVAEATPLEAEPPDAGPEADARDAALR